MFRDISASLVLLAALLSPAQAQDSQTCQLKQYAALDMWTEPEGRVTVPMTLNGRTLRFLVDTGGVISTMDPHIAAQLQLKSLVTAERIGGVGNSGSNLIVKPASIDLGGAQAGETAFYLLPTVRQEAGTIAPNLLRNFDLDFDFANGKLNLFSPDHCAGRVVYWSQGAVAVVPMQLDSNNHITIPAAIDGKTIEATVDTGARDTLMSMRMASRYLGVRPDDPLLRPVSPGATIYLYPFRTISFAGVTVNNPHILIVPDAEMKNLSATQLLLGIASLRQMHMYVAYNERKLYLTPALAH